MAASRRAVEDIAFQVIAEKVPRAGIGDFINAREVDRCDFFAFGDIQPAAIDEMQQGGILAELFGRIVVQDFTGFCQIFIQQIGPDSIFMDDVLHVRYSER